MFFLGSEAFYICILSRNIVMECPMSVHELLVQCVGKCFGWLEDTIYNGSISH